jgi:hypothetical protein
MIQLPNEMRQTLIEQMDEYIDSLPGTPDAETVAEAVLEIIETVAEEMKVDEAEDIIAKLETSGELEATLLEVLENEFDGDEDFDFTGTDIVRMLEKVCDVEWSATDDSDDEDEDEDKDEDEDDPDGFFDEIGGDDEDE